MNQPKQSATRVHDPIGGQPDLDRYFAAYDRYFHDLAGYEPHLQRLVACYSRGDGPAELRASFSVAVAKLVAADAKSRASYGPTKRIFAHQNRFATVFRDALVFLSFGLCLRAPRAEVEAVLQCCDRGDPLLEVLAHAAAPGTEELAGPPGYYELFDRLYDVVTAPEGERSRSIEEYLEVWYVEKMTDFPFKDQHLLVDQPHYVGYWCFEAAGMVAALGIDDAAFADHPHYPRDLAASYRSARA